MSANAEQLLAIANRLHDTSGHFYRVAEEVLERKLTDEETTDDALWNAVCEAGGIFKCETCNLWQSDSLRGGISDICADCEGEED